LNREELIKQLSEEFELNPDKISDFVKILFDTILSSLGKGNNVNIAGFGKFIRRDKKVFFAPTQKLASDVNYNYSGLTVLKVRAFNEKEFQDRINALRNKHKNLEVELSDYMVGPEFPVLEEEKKETEEKPMPAELKSDTQKLGEYITNLGRSYGTDVDDKLMSELEEFFKKRFTKAGTEEYETGYEMPEFTIDESLNIFASLEDPLSKEKKIELKPTDDSKPTMGAAPVQEQEIPKIEEPPADIFIAPRKYYGEEPEAVPTVEETVTEQIADSVVSPEIMQEEIPGEIKEEIKQKFEEEIKEIETRKIPVKAEETIIPDENKIIEEVKIDIVEAKIDIVEAKTDIVEAKTDFVEAKTDFVEAKTEVEEAKTDIGEIKTDIREIKTDIEEAKTDIEELKKEGVDLSKLIAEREQAIKKLEKLREQQFDEEEIKLHPHDTKPEQTIVPSPAPRSESEELDFLEKRRKEILEKLEKEEIKTPEITLPIIPIVPEIPVTQEISLQPIDAEIPKIDSVEKPLEIENLELKVFDTINKKERAEDNFDEMIAGLEKIKDNLKHTEIPPAEMPAAEPEPIPATEEKETPLMPPISAEIQKLHEEISKPPEKSIPDDTNGFSDVFVDKDKMIDLDAGKQRTDELFKSLDIKNYDDVFFRFEEEKKAKANEKQLWAKRRRGDIVLWISILVILIIFGLIIYSTLKD
jgi:nucleoid DNA-binding protein